MIKTKSAISGTPAHKPACRYVLVPLLLLAAWTLYAVPLPDAELSRAYTRIAGGIAETQTDAAMELLDAALEFDPGNGDAGYLKARILLDSDSALSIRAPVAALEAAIAEDRWDLVDSREAVLLLAGLYDRLRRYESQYRLLLTVPPGRRVTGDWYYLAARARHLSGDRPAALALLREGSRLFPGHDRIQTMRIRTDEEYRAFLAAAVLDSRREPPTEEVLGELILSGGEPRELLQHRFLELGYGTPEVLLQIAASESSEIDAPDPDQLLDPAFFRRRENLVSVYQIFSENERLDELETYLEDKTLTIDEDTDGDGYDDRRYRLKEGSLVSFGIDGDQDGVEETRGSLIPGAVAPSPAELTFTLTEGEATVRYSAYPEVESLDTLINNEERLYQFAPGVYRLDAVSASSLPPVIEVSLPLVINPERLEALAYSLTQSRPGFKIRKDPSGAVLELSGEKRVLRYSVDGADYVERDVDGNGFREIREVYRGTLLEEVLLDQDENGIFEYRYYPPRELEEWDFDQDGSVDLRRKKDGLLQ